MTSRIYISCNQMPRTGQSLGALLDRIGHSTLRDAEIHIVHSSDWVYDNALDNFNTVLHNSGQDHTAYEYPAIRQMWLDSQNEDFYGLYLHCKGASKVNPLQWDNSMAWADYMLLGVVDNADLCRDHMAAGADLVGSMWHWHWKGNFFWYKSQYIRQLLDPSTMDMNNRFNCEYWCSFGYWQEKYPIARIKNLFYIHSLLDDNDFLRHWQQSYIPDFEDKFQLNVPFGQFLEKQWYGAFDIIHVTAAELEKHRHMIGKYVNYDSKLVITDTGEIHDANSLLH